VVCGGLGDYEDNRVRAVAAVLGVGLAPVHRDATSVLLLDRPAMTWEAPDRRGVAWSEGLISAGPVRTWGDAACRWGACGLVVEGDRRYLHTSVSGVAPVYYLQTGRATYFASRIDALVHAADARLTVDWDAWAAIFFLRHPLDSRTPFLEVRRLTPFSVLEPRPGGGARVSPGRWPWAEVRSDRTAAAAADGVVERARSAVGRLPAERVLCPLSGGWDSRLLLCLLHRERPNRLAGAFTSRLMAKHDESFATEVTASLGVPHTVVDASGEGFPSDFAMSCERMDYQWVSRGAFVSLVRRLQPEGGLVADGLALDVLFRLTREWMLLPGADMGAGMWERMSEPGWETVLSAPLGRAMRASARRQVQAAVDRWRGHPAQALMTTYCHRTVRGVSLNPTALMGRELSVGMPFIDHELAMSAISVAPAEKLGWRLFRAVFDRVDSKVGALPSTNDDQLPPPPSQLSRPNSPSARPLYAWAAREGPLSEHMHPEMRERLTRKSVGKHFVRAVTMFALWHQRYRERLREVDPRAVLHLAIAGLAAAGQWGEHSLASAPM
jgi:asparagine synthetase B (glutamine-hydrolysing)